MLVRKGTILVTKGARESRFRPSIDTLFRSAAVAYGSGATGVILSGLLDDGIVGLAAIKNCGGTAMVQDPGDALYRDMPQSALDRVDVDYCLPIAEMGGQLVRMAGRRGWPCACSKSAGTCSSTWPGKAHHPGTFPCWTVRARRKSTWTVSGPYWSRIPKATPFRYPP